MASLYDDLGVTAEATTPEIKSAYRKKVKTAHPDAPGGFREKFDRLSTALSVLTDPRRRDQYDRTGQIEEAEPDNREGKAKQLAFQQICGIMAELEKRGANPAKVDVLSLSVTGLRDQIREFEKKLAAAQKDEDKARKLAKRFHAKRGKTNFLRLMLEARANDVVTVKVALVKDKELAEMAIKVLQDHTFDVEAEEFHRPGMYQSPFDMLMR